MQLNPALIFLQLISARPTFKIKDLEIVYQYIPADKDTKYTEENTYNDFYKATQMADSEFVVKKIVNIPNAHSKNIISFSNWFVLIIDRILYLIFIFLTLGQIYKYIISCFISEKVITITKVISDHYDLASTDSFLNIQPDVNVFGKKIEYKREKYAFKNSNDLQNMVTEENPLSDDFINFASQQSKNFIEFERNNHSINKEMEKLV